MSALSVKNVREAMEGKYPVLYADIDGRPARMTIFQKSRWLDDYGAVFLGADWEEFAQVEIPADDANGQAALTLRGFVQDEGVAKLYRDFLDKWGAG